MKRRSSAACIGFGISIGFFLALILIYWLQSPLVSPPIKPAPSTPVFDTQPLAVEQSNGINYYILDKFGMQVFSPLPAIRQVCIWIDIGRKESAVATGRNYPTRSSGLSCSILDQQDWSTYTDRYPPR